MRKAYIVNTPTFFSSIWSVASYLWDEDQKKKMIFLGSDYKEIFQVVDSAFVPVEFGGTCEWELPKGGPITNYNLQFPVDERVWKKVVVPRADKFAETVHFPNYSPEMEGVVKWEFKTKDYDIEFGVFHSETLEHNRSPIVKSEKVQSNVFTISGSLKLTKSGYYHFTWDNTFSWTRSKDLEFILEIEGGGEHKIVQK